MTRPLGSLCLALLPALLSAQNDWPAHGRDAAETRFSPLNSINTSNVKRLGLAWSYDTQSSRGLEATPLVVNGTMYATASWSVVFALDARTGKQLWRWDPEVARSYGQRACCDVVNRGVAFSDGRVFASILDGRLAALDASTGKLIWQVQTTDPSQPYTITGAPRVVKGKIIIGNGGAEFGVRGYISAYDAATGKLAWRFYTVPGDPAKRFESPALERAAKTWSGQWWKMGGGGTAWDSFAYDPALDLLYAGTGNGSPWIRELRSPQGGDNLYLCSILALRPGTGELVWHYQTTPGDTWDYTSTQQIILADLDIAGRKRQVLMQAPKNGFFYVLDRRTGELLSADPFSKVTWASHVDLNTGRPVETPNARFETGTQIITPGPFGAHNWHSMSFHPKTGLVYIPAQEVPFPYTRNPDFKYRPGWRNEGVVRHPSDQPFSPTPGYLLAWDPRAREERWRVNHKSNANGGTLATAGDLVFQGAASGYFAAYHAATGEKLWEVFLGNGIVAAPIAFELDGRQYVSILAGWGGADGVILGLNASGAYKAPGRLWTFSLDGVQPLAPVRSRMRPPLTRVSSDASPEKIERGMALYAETCAGCHGRGASSGGVISDLRYSSPSVFNNYPAILLDGTYLELGMPSFKGRLTPAEVDSIRAFVLSQRARLAATGKR